MALVERVVARSFGEELIVRRNVFGQVQNLTTRQLHGIQQRDLMAVNFTRERLAMRAAALWCW